MLRMSPTSTTQKSINLVDEFDEDDFDENEVRKASTSMKRLTGADYPSFNHVNHTISNIISNSAKNVSNYLTPDAKRAFDQLCQAFTEALIL